MNILASYSTRRILLSTASLLAVATCCAQSSLEDGTQLLPVQKERESIPFNAPIPALSQEYNNVLPAEYRKFKFDDMNLNNLQDSIEKMQLPYMDGLLQNDIFGIKHLGLYAASTNFSYTNLLDSRSVSFAFGYNKGNLRIETGIIANQYSMAWNATTQFGVNGFFEYRLSPHWSVALFGSVYNHNPYYSMAAYPFIGTSSYGGWIKYEGEKVGVKLGARRYYDSFQRQWKMEPIITPSIKLGKKIVLELPVGPLVQKSLEQLFKKKRNNGPIIMPNFN